MRFERRHTSAGQSPYAGIAFRKALSEIRNPDGSVKMNDQQYYLFFAGLMFVAAALYVVVARSYREKTYLQSQDGSREAIGT